MAKARKKKNIRTVYYFLFILIPVVLFFVFQASKTNELNDVLDFPLIVPETGGEGRFYHAHVDFKVFIEGKEMNFNKPEFNEVDQHIHLHLNNPNGDKIIHIEGKEVAIRIFFSSLGMDFEPDCFVLETGESFCNGRNKKLSFFVNGQENFDFGLYIPKDLDRILITYGNESREEIQKQIDSVTDFACIYSQKCPERIPSLPMPQEKIQF